MVLVISSDWLGGTTAIIQPYLRLGQNENPTGGYKFNFMSHDLLSLEKEEHAFVGNS